MLIDEKGKLNDFLLKIAETLDIPEHFYEDTVLKYEDIGSWLAADDSKLKVYSPEIYPQGSFRLGTVVRPISKNDEYDIDLVCLLNLDKAQTSQANLKQIVGDRLKERDDLKNILTPGRRCWKLDYPAQAQIPLFHMDVLPAIPNSERLPTGILLTDRELTHWHKSNPKAYADWFYDRMKVIFLQKRNELAKLIESANVEDVPEWEVKTPLQRVVQILKRHRDIYFQGRSDYRPASIIINTLAARAYNNQANIYDALVEILRTIESNLGKPGFIENRSGRWWVANPVEDENFADKWNDYPDRREAFMEWLKRVSEDFTKIGKKQTLDEAVDLLMPLIGEQTIIKVANSLGIRKQSSLPALIMPQTQVPAIGDSRHCQSPLWSVREIYKAKVKGSICSKQGGRRLWELTDRPVPKNIWLRFSVATNTPLPYSVKWQVVNTGKEALDAGQLRGDFYDNDVPTNNVRWERTLYKGTHWVEAFVIKNGLCVARSGRKIVKIR